MILTSYPGRLNSEIMQTDKIRKPDLSFDFKMFRSQVTQLISQTIGTVQMHEGKIFQICKLFGRLFFQILHFLQNFIL